MTEHEILERVLLRSTDPLSINVRGGLDGEAFDQYGDRRGEYVEHVTSPVALAFIDAAQTRAMNGCQCGCGECFAA